MASNESPAAWRVLRNESEQLSLWPAISAIPRGWSATGIEGSVDYCAAYVDQIASPIPQTRPDPAKTSRSVATDLVRQAAATPGAIALTDSHRSLTYHELMDAAETVAHRLQDLGAGPGARVLVHFPPSIAGALAVVAVMLTGATYVPVDPSYPSNWLGRVIRDCEPCCVISDRLQNETVPLCAAIGDLVGEFRLSRSVAGSDAATASTRALPDTVYVIYTSGSTGLSKGVMVGNTSLLHYCEWAAQAYPSVHQSALLHSPLSFDLTVTSLLVPLLKGGCVIVGSLLDGADLLRALGGRPLQFLKATPSHLPFINLLPGAAVPKGHLVLGGEALDYKDIARLRRSYPSLTIVNEYGPTETTVGCLYYVASELKDSGPVPIGAPAPGIGAYVLNSDLSPVRAGSAGELFIGGLGVAHGYLARPGLTATRFVADPTGIGARMYRTGDRVRRAQDGRFEFLGRLDHQLKVNGHRIEPAEVEFAIREYPGVSRAVVVGRATRPNSPRSLRLIAYFTTESEIIVSARSLREFCARALPPHLIPSAFIWLPAIPLTSHGKVDQSALPDPDFQLGAEVTGMDELARRA